MLVGWLVFRLFDLNLLFFRSFCGHQDAKPPSKRREHLNIRSHFWKDCSTIPTNSLPNWMFWQESIVEKSTANPGATQGCCIDTIQDFLIKLGIKPRFDVLEKNISEQNSGISSEILPSFRTEAVEDRDVIFSQIQRS